MPHTELGWLELRVNCGMAKLFRPWESSGYDFSSPITMHIRVNMRIPVCISKGELPKCWKILEGRSPEVKMIRIQCVDFQAENLLRPTVFNSKCQHVIKDQKRSVCQQWFGGAPVEVGLSGKQFLRLRCPWQEVHWGILSAASYRREWGQQGWAERDVELGWSSETQMVLRRCIHWD